MTTTAMKWQRIYDSEGDADYVCRHYRITWSYRGFAASGPREWHVERQGLRLCPAYPTLAQAKAAAEKDAKGANQ